MLLLTLAAMAVNWMATTILVEAYVLQPVRDWLGGTTRTTRSAWSTTRHTYEEATVTEHRRPKIAYLVGCHLCTGTWVGFAIAAFVPLPFTGAVAFAPAAFILNGLLTKAGGHAILHLSNLSERIGR